MSRHRHSKNMFLATIDVVFFFWMKLKGLDICCDWLRDNQNGNSCPWFTKKIYIYILTDLLYVINPNRKDRKIMHSLLALLYVRCRFFILNRIDWMHWRELEVICLDYVRFSNSPIKHIAYLSPGSVFLPNAKLWNFTSKSSRALRAI